MIFVEIVISLLILIGAFFLFVGSLGLAKLPDLMRRLHGPTKATTLGVGSMLIASMLYFWVFEENPSVHELLITLFLFLTAPVTAQKIIETDADTAFEAFDLFFGLNVDGFRRPVENPARIARVRLNGFHSALFKFGAFFIRVNNHVNERLKRNDRIIAQKTEFSAPDD